MATLFPLCPACNRCTSCLMEARTEGNNSARNASSDGGSHHRLREGWGDIVDSDRGQSPV